jgi:hypothetical protein
MLEHSKPQRRQLHQLALASRFRLRYLSSKGRDPVVTTPLVVKMRVRPPVGLFDQPLLQHFAWIDWYCPALQSD